MQQQKCILRHFLYVRQFAHLRNIHPVRTFDIFIVGSILFGTALMLGILLMPVASLDFWPSWMSMDTWRPVFSHLVMFLLAASAISLGLDVFKNYIKTYEKHMTTLKASKARMKAIGLSGGTWLRLSIISSQIVFILTILFLQAGDYLFVLSLVVLGNIIFIVYVWHTLRCLGNLNTEDWRYIFSIRARDGQQIQIEEIFNMTSVNPPVVMRGNKEIKPLAVTDLHEALTICAQNNLWERQDELRNLYEQVKQYIGNLIQDENIIYDHDSYALTLSKIEGHCRRKISMPKVRRYRELTNDDIKTYIVGYLGIWGYNSSSNIELQRIFSKIHTDLFDYLEISQRIQTLNSNTRWSLAGAYMQEKWIRRAIQNLGDLSDDNALNGETLKQLGILFSFYLISAFNAK